MNRLLVLLLCLCLGLQSFAEATPRKKVAVVLSGGGAKGTAHVSALKVIEEAGIPIDMVVGTSMGSIVGGLYAIGYTTNQLDSIVKAQNWTQLLTDGSSRRNRSLRENLENDRYILNVPFNRTPTEALTGGLLKGNNIGKLFSELTVGYHDSIDFNQLPIPFACVSVDIIHNKEIDFHSGILAECMRASMSIPGAFAPIKKNGMVLVDGGLANNFPVDVAREMGADVVIGVNVSDKRLTAEELNTTTDMLSQILNVVCENKFDDNVKMTDVLINVNVEGFSAASFSDEAIRTLMARGDEAAREKWNDLIFLRESLGLTEPVAVRTPRVIPPHTESNTIASLQHHTPQNSIVRFGARFDNEELASILLGGSYRLRKTSDLYAGLELRLGKRISAKISLDGKAFGQWRFNAGYLFKENEIKLYDEGTSAGLMNFTEHHGLISLSRSWRNILLTGGVDMAALSFHDILANDKWISLVDLQNLKENSISYYASMQFNNQDAPFLPRKGMKWFLKYTFYTDNWLHYDDGPGLHILEGNWNVAIPVSRRFTLLPSVSGRILPMRNNHITNMNYLSAWGLDGHYTSQQLGFAGVRYMELSSNKTLILALSARQSIGRSTYLFGVTNYGLVGDEYEGLLNTTNIFGAAAGAGIRTAIGPVEARFNWSTLTNTVGFFMNIGHVF